MVVGVVVVGVVVGHGGDGLGWRSGVSSVGVSSPSESCSSSGRLPQSLHDDAPVSRGNQT